MDPAPAASSCCKASCASRAACWAACTSFSTCSKSYDLWGFNHPFGGAGFRWPIHSMMNCWELSNTVNLCKSWDYKGSERDYDGIIYDGINPSTTWCRISQTMELSPCLLRVSQSFFGFQQSSLAGSAGVASVGRGSTLKDFQSTVLVEAGSTAQLSGWTMQWCNVGNPIRNPSEIHRQWVFVEPSPKLEVLFIIGFPTRMINPNRPPKSLYQCTIWLLQALVLGIRHWKNPGHQWMAWNNNCWWTSKWCGMSRTFPAFTVPERLPVASVCATSALIQKKKHRTKWRESSTIGYSKADRIW